MRRILLLVCLLVLLGGLQSTIRISRADDGTVPICHFPPGNPTAPGQTLVVGQNAADAHLRNHARDYAGPCTPDQMSPTGVSLAICGLMVLLWAGYELWRQRRIRV